MPVSFMPMSFISFMSLLPLGDGIPRSLRVVTIPLSGGSTSLGGISTALGGISTALSGISASLRRICTSMSGVAMARCFHVGLRKAVRMHPKKHEIRSTR